MHPFIYFKLYRQNKINEWTIEANIIIMSLSSSKDLLKIFKSRKKKDSLQKEYFQNNSPFSYLNLNEILAGMGEKVTS